MLPLLIFAKSHGQIMQPPCSSLILAKGHAQVAYFSAALLIEHPRKFGKVLTLEGAELALLIFAKGQVRVASYSSALLL